MSAFEKIIGYKSEKEELERIADIVKNPEKYEKMGVRIPSGLLFDGKPGVGKTLMAVCFIEECGLPCITCRKSKPDGDFVEEINKIFAEAEEKSPCIVFLDDVDKFSESERRYSDAEEFTAIQSCIDRLQGKRVFVVATSKCKEKMPMSLLRPGRLERLML